MDNDTYDDRHSTQQTFNRNIVKRIQELEDYRPNDQTNIKLMKQEEFNEKVLIRLDQEIENRTQAFERIRELETQVETLQAFNYNTDIKLERIDDILVVHRNQTDNQRKNFCALRRVLDDKVMDLLEKGEHGEHK